MRGKCSDCNCSTDKTVSMKRGAIEVCEACAEKPEYSKFKARKVIKYVPFSSMMLLPPAPHLCQECAVDHQPEYPHDLNSLYYGSKFYMANGRSPTWDDAMSHCTDEMKTNWKIAMQKVQKNTVIE